MKNIPETKGRLALCAAWPCFSQWKTILEQGTLEGFITDKPRGEKGFGCDPVFIPALGKLFRDFHR